MSSGRVLALKIVKSLLIYSSHPDHKSDPAFLKWPDNSPKTIDHYHLDVSRDDGMDEHGIAWLYGCHRVGFLLGKLLSNHCYDFHQVLTTNLTQHDVLHGPDDSSKTIDYHHLDMSRDHGNMDEHGIDWLYGCHRVGFLLGKLLSNHC
jgi:hypothetical protein